ncbi:hypothetical protein [Paenibacillus gansuensis]|uniref:Copper amine oxidase-like N-terminal domain-containing protein n=1 Tax=Paenibacillus gansuensis TaxID=306542 RepID=A0ABW5PBX4_9BACL
MKKRLIWGLLLCLTVSGAAAGTLLQEGSASAEPSRFQVNGISLGQTKTAVVQKKGEPVSIVKDRLLGTEEYRYRDAKVGFYDGRVEYISLAAARRYMSLDGKLVGISRAGLTGVFGAADYRAEDGMVFIQADTAFKAYTDPETGAIVSVDYFFGDET